MKMLPYKLDISSFLNLLMQLSDDVFLALLSMEVYSPVFENAVFNFDEYLKGNYYSKYLLFLYDILSNLLFVIGCETSNLQGTPPPDLTMHKSTIRFLLRNVLNF